MEDLKKLVDGYLEATNRHDLAAFDQLFAKDFVNYAAGMDPIAGCEAMKSTMKELLEAFPDWHIRCEDIICEDNKITVRWSLTATHKNDYKDITATGMKIKVEGIYIDHIENGKIAKRWACNNFSGVFATLKNNQSRARQ